ncbi:MAG: hypothetical protein M3Y32_03355 [Pseudomonadota bacterium]|nr:hypothetical protein [Pseudomonadota bacterium]
MMANRQPLSCQRALGAHLVDTELESVASRRAELHAAADAALFLRDLLSRARGRVS